MKNKMGRESVVQFTRSEGSSVFVKDRGQEERIREALNDLHLAIQGLIAHPSVDWRQSIAALARICSIFLRKTVIGDRNDRRTRLLDDEFCQKADFGFHRIRRVSSERKTIIVEHLETGSSHMVVEKFDDVSSEPIASQTIPIGPQRLQISVEWPLPGMVGWVHQPTTKSPWVIEMGELFELSSSSKLDCNNWLGQQLVLFDNRGITLKDVIRVTANSEGAHSAPVSDLSRVKGEEDRARSKIVKDRDIYILSRIEICRVRYSHAIVIETAFYLFIELARSISFEKPEDGWPIPLLCFTPNAVFSPDQKWLRFDGGLTLTLGGASQSISHIIRAPKSR